MYEKMEEFTVDNIFEGLLQLLQGPSHPCPECQQLYLKTNTMHMDHESIIQQYKPLRLHECLFQQWKQEWFTPSFQKLHENIIHNTEFNLESAIRNGWLIEESPGVYSFELMTDSFCDMLIEEYEHYRSSGLPIRRPNSMNNYGLILGSIGWENMMLTFQEIYIHPLARALFPKEGANLDAHHTFIAHYETGKDLGLDMHTDDSDVTLNLCLGKHFEGAELSFCGHIGQSDHRHFRKSYQHRKGRAIIHLGQQRHGAGNIATGERVNLIVWNRAFDWRSSKDYFPRHEQEASRPDAVCLSYTHDRDYTAYKPPVDTSSRPWCPLKGMEYPGFDEIAGRKRLRT